MVTIQTIQLSVRTFCLENSQHPPFEGGKGGMSLFGISQIDFDLPKILHIYPVNLVNSVKTLLTVPAKSVKSARHKQTHTAG